MTEELRDCKTKTFSACPQDLQKMEALMQRRKESYPQESIRYWSRSAIMRDGLDMLYRYEVLGESIVHPDDCRFS